MLLEYIFGQGTFITYISDVLFFVGLATWLNYLFRRFIKLTPVKKWVNITVSLISMIALLVVLLFINNTTSDPDPYFSNQTYSSHFAFSFWLGMYHMLKASKETILMFKRTWAGLWMPILFFII